MLLRLDVQPFTRPQAGQLIGSVLDGDVDDGVIDRSQQMAEGNPLYLRGLLAYAAREKLHGLATEICDLCRVDPTRDAPLVQALIAAADPETGRPLTDEDIRDELVIFL